jgi:ribosomal protein L32
MTNKRKTHVHSYSHDNPSYNVCQKRGDWWRPNATTRRAVRERKELALSAKGKKK